MAVTPETRVMVLRCVHSGIKLYAFAMKYYPNVKKNIIDASYLEMENKIKIHDIMSYADNEKSESLWRIIHYIKNSSLSRILQWYRMLHDDLASLYSVQIGGYIERKH